MSKLQFGVYAIGGLVKAFLKYRFDLAINILLTVKQNIRPDKPIHMFGLGLPQFFSLAVACGCDLMDSAAYILFAKENRYFTLSTGTEKLEDLKEFPCHCPICIDNTPKEVLALEDVLKTELIAKHNLHVSFSELKTIRQAIREGNLWELVEQRIRAHPALFNAARGIRKHVSYLEEHEKIYKPKGRLYTSSDGVYRPLIKRYDDKLIKNYRIPLQIKTLMLLPELGTRPKNSPTMVKWLNTIEHSDETVLKSIHACFFSLIYGIIPLELIDTYPLSQYESIKKQDKDIPMYTTSIQKCLDFLDKNGHTYDTMAFLIPEKFENEFGEIEIFPEEDPIQELYSRLRSKNGSKILKFNTLEELLKHIINK